ncbi:MAG: hypothetical protein JOZ32_14125 [Bryobacterales bacterium]|nr:hypothetical protein [Bryobacterales bacterium]
MNEATSELLADTNDIVREQLALAWREHVDHVRNVLEAQWPERMERVIEETIAGLAARVEQEYEDTLAARLQQTVRSGEIARRELIQQLNQVTRRLCSFEDERQWSNTLVDSTRGFCGRAALFLINDRRLSLETTRNFDDASLTDDVSLEAAPAFASAVETRDTLVAVRCSGELSSEIAAYVDSEDSDERNGKCYLLPVITREGVRAVLYADSEDVDVNALELLTAIAGAVYERHSSAGAMAFPAPSDGLVSITTPPHRPEFHLRALNWARVRVAEMKLHQSEKVRNGRIERKLYTSLKKEIDSARKDFRGEFLKTPGSMVDYLHVELVRTLAYDDAQVLGHDYPGPLV